MGIAKPKQSSIPDFNLPEQFKTDIWEITTWEKYTKETKERKKVWNERSKTTEGNFDFTLCKNTVIREELKYVIYKKYNGKIYISTFAYYYDYFKKIAKFINTTDYDSLAEIEDSSEFAEFLSRVEKNKVSVSNGTRINSNMKKVKQNRTSRIISFFNVCITTITDLYHDESNLSLMERDIWKGADIQKYNRSKHGESANICFFDIKQPEFKLYAKIFCKSRFGIISNKTIKSYITFVTVFSQWIDTHYPNIQHFNDLDRNIMEEYFCYLRTESGLSDNRINYHILYLKAFLDTLSLLDLDNLPTVPLIINNDYNFKSKKQGKYFTQSEIDNIKKAIKYMDKTDGKIVFCLLVLGVRISELLTLKPENIQQNEDGSYYAVISQVKTIAEYAKQLETTVAKILLAEIEANRKKLGAEPEYVFLSKSGKKMEYTAFTRRINKVFYDHNVLDKDGRILRFTTHRFRHTFATNMINAGYGAEVTAKAIGHSTLDALTHYAEIHKETSFRQMEPRLKKDDMLIRNIGKMEKAEFSQPKEAIPLCNGYCTRNAATGICKKANFCLSCSMFIPSPEYLNNYCMQLQEVEAAIEVAKANDMDILVQENLKIKANLEKIIEKVRGRLDEERKVND